MTALKPASAPAPGSLPYFVLLYSDAARRDTLATLLALSEEIATGMEGSLDHAVAHVRLDWWAEEARRYARGDAQHPWLRWLLQTQPERADRLDLAPLVNGAAIDFANHSHGATSDGGLRRALFVLLAQALGVSTPSAPALAALGQIGELSRQLERYAQGALAALDVSHARRALQAEIQRIELALQPRLAPLLVWSALAAARAMRRERRGAQRRTSRLDPLADNWLAWRSARRAARGHFRIA